MLSELIGNRVSAGECIKSLLARSDYQKMKMMVAFAKQAGVSRLLNDFRGFINGGGSFEGILGIDHHVTTVQGLQQLTTLSKDIYIHHEKNISTFHPKVYIFEGKKDTAVIIGSANLTCGGLFVNCEASVLLKSENTAEDRNFISDLQDYYNSVLKDTNTKLADSTLISNLFNQGLVADETRTRDFSGIIKRVSAIPFGSGKQRRPPPAPSVSQARVSVPSKFLVTLSVFDVSHRSADPVILIPLRALKDHPAFWEWPASFTLSAGGYPERYVSANVVLPSQTFQNFFIRIYYYERKSEFRLQCEPIKRNGRAGDMMLIERNSSERAPYYTIRLVSKTTSEYTSLVRNCPHVVSSQKRYGYL